MNGPIYVFCEMPVTNDALIVPVFAFSIDGAIAEVKTIHGIEVERIKEGDVQASEATHRSTDGRFWKIIPDDHAPEWLVKRLTEEL